MQTKTGVSEPCKQDGVPLSNVMTDRLNELECIDEMKIRMRDKKKKDYCNQVNEETKDKERQRMTEARGEKNQGKTFINV